MTDIPQHLANVCGRISAAALKRGLSAGDVRLVAVSKTVDDERVLAAYAAGHRDFGENRVQEMVDKAARLPSDIRWHMIGHLQGNKAVAAVTVADLIHSVDSLKLLQRIDRAAAELGKTQEVLLQAAVPSDPAKHGATYGELGEMIAAGGDNIEIRGFMTMAPVAVSEAELRDIFGRLRCFRDDMEDRHSRPFPELSMGMSGDFEIAVGEGATIVRVGTAVFGKRDE